MYCLLLLLFFFFFFLFYRRGEYRKHLRTTEDAYLFLAYVRTRALSLTFLVKVFFDVFLSG